MIRVIALCSLLAASTLTAATEPSRQKLSGFNGIAFGTPFDVAKQKLGPDFKESSKKNEPDTKMLLGTAMAFGENFAVNYSFERADKMTIVYAIAKIKPGDFSVCKTHWATVLAELNKAYGKPDTDDNKLSDDWPTQFVTYKFKDGANIEASLIGCLLMVNFIAPVPKA